MGIRLNEKDRAILHDTARFKGLSAESIRQVHFNGSTYAWKRLAALQSNGYIERKYYYALNKTQDGMKHSQRIAAIYYPTTKGLKAIDYKIDPRYVVPDDSKLDVHFMVSKLYTSMPNLISKREAQDKYGLKSFMPVACVFPSNPPVYISILGKNKNPWEPSKLVKFFEQSIFPGTYVATSKTLPGEKLLDTQSHYINWDLAPEVVPLMVQNKNHYLDEFLTKFIDATIIDYNYPFVKIQIPGYGVFHVGELLTGSTRLMDLLSNPPDNTYIYVQSLKLLHDVINLESGSFRAFARQDMKLYEVFKEEGGVKYQFIK